MNKVLKVLAGVVLVVLLLVGGIYLWATLATNRTLARTIETHTVDIPVPFPLTPEEVEALGVDPADVDEVARDRAVERGQHLVNSRYFCTECHGENLAGGTMIDAFPIGTLLGPNITLGEGSRIRDYTSSDWDRIVRHGVRPDGRPAVMPSEDFELMTDQELSDIVAYIRTFPPVDNVVPAPSLGPLGRLLVALGQIPLSADLMGSHTAAHEAYPPPAAVSVEFGRHLANICTGCHGSNLAGGPIPGGDPSWPPARNITPHTDGIGAWDYEDFVAAMREGIRPDGTEIVAPMALMVPYMRRMTDVEMQAMWTFLESVPPVSGTE